MIWTTDDCVVETFCAYHFGLSSGHSTCVECRGKVANKTTRYTKNNYEIYLGSQSNCRVASSGSFAVNRLVTSPAYLCGGHRELDAPPTMPLWCPVITRIVTKDTEARCESAAGNIQKELSNMNSKSGTLVKCIRSQISFAIPKS